MQKEYHISTHMLLHRCRFYVYIMSCTDGTKSKFENTTYDSMTQKSPNSVVNIFGHTYAIYKLKDNTCTNVSENTFNRFKVMEAIPFIN